MPNVVPALRAVIAMVREDIITHGRTTPRRSDEMIVEMNDPHSPHGIVGHYVPKKCWVQGARHTAKLYESGMTAPGPIIDDDDVP